MQTVDDKPETIHLYVVREEETPSLFPIFLSALALFVLVVIGLFPYQQPEVRAVIRVPAVPLPLETFSTSVQIIPTGIKTYPATTAHGILTITNGSVISSVLPKGMIISGVVLDYSVFVPSGSANGYGYATISAHALTSGKIGNIPAYRINNVVNASIYIRNLQSFTGGKDGYSVKLVTSQDHDLALAKARSILVNQTIGRLVSSPCKEKISRKITVTWICQFVSYSVPSYMKVLGVRVVGKNVLVHVSYVERKRIFVAK